MNIIKKLLIALTICSVSSLTLANKFPVTIDTRFGPVTIEKQPQRIVTLDFGGADNLLALGVQPLTIRDWYSDFPNSLGPWASKLLKNKPIIVDFPLDIDLIAKQKPDLILALWSGIDKNDFNKLSAIAPVIAAPKVYKEAYRLPWDETYRLDWEQRAIIAGRAIGKEELAKEKVNAIKKKFAQIRAKHPNWKDKTYCIVFTFDKIFYTYGENDYYKDMRYVYSNKDFRNITFSEFGLTFNPEIAKNFGIAHSYTSYKYNSKVYEELPDSDVVVWMNNNKEDLDTFESRKALPSYKEGREAIFDYEISAALSHSTLLSLSYFIDRATPLLEKALSKKRKETNNSNKVEK